MGNTPTDMVCTAIRSTIRRGNIHSQHLKAMPCSRYFSYSRRRHGVWLSYFDCKATVTVNCLAHLRTSELHCSTLPGLQFLGPLFSRTDCLVGSSYVANFFRRPDIVFCVISSLRYNYNTCFIAVAEKVVYANFT